MMDVSDVLAICAELHRRGDLVPTGMDEDSTPRYEVTDKGRFALAEAKWKAL